MTSPTPLADRCIEFQGARNNMGYGVRRADGKLRLTHRWVLASLHGWDALEGKVVQHHCDNPACFRASHLQIGTHKSNTQDMVRKGRARGNTNPSKRRLLTDEQVATIRSEIGTSGAELGRRFGVTKETVNKIRRGESYFKMQGA